MASDRISVRLDDESRQQIEELVRETGRSESEIVRDGIAYVYRSGRKRARGKNPPETLLDRLTRLGVIGCAKGLPPDLSTNPKYMEGFGGGR